MKQSLDLKLGQHLTITPQLQQAIRLLQLSSLELQQEIQEALEVAKVAALSESTRPAGGLDEIRSTTFDENALAAQGYGHERLDQLVTELLLGVR